ncbi:hypothetical protein PCASD_14328 [Puccinia coronata f. sp. avenae]|uniref:Uncharacterized protein n=1 Tax=Puccinia coronata f. sp. avenae TaxID=200324 RepID=A0A2N5T3A9_9BASI|nr:hypothetical protein PCASD_17706 [Puccinia coronata f. sp. avenae]PLW32375.1 hypothetical protein PCASD_14328 [Puccinia coronata f. sp. avenae]
MDRPSPLQKRASFLLPSTYSAPPPGYVTPEWPSLYGPNSDGVYLYVPSTIWKFTLYWTLLLEGIVFMGCGLLASYTFWRSGAKKMIKGGRMKGKEMEREDSPRKRMLKKRRRSASSTQNQDEWIPLNRRRASSIITTIHHPAQHFNQPRRPFSSLLITPAFFFISFSFSAAISGSLVGWAIAALYNAAFLRMSTWVPALWSAGLTLILIISSYSNISTVL